MFQSYRNQSVDLLCNSTDWFLYGGNIGVFRGYRKRPVALNWLIPPSLSDKISAYLVKHRHWKIWNLEHFGLVSQAQESIFLNIIQNYICIKELLRYFNFEPSFKMRLCRARDLFVSQIPVTTGGFDQEGLKVHPIRITLVHEFILVNKDIHHRKVYVLND